MKFNHLVYIALVIFILLFFNECSKDPEVKTVTKIKTVRDTITNTIISKPKDVIFYKTDTIHEKETVFIKNSNPIKAKEYDTKLESNNATADLKIITTGELLDVQGVITYPEKETTLIKPKSGLFLNLETSVKPTFERVGVSLDYQIKNKWLIGVGASYNNQVKQGYINAKIGFKLF